MATIDPILKDCLAKVDPATRAEVRRNMATIEERYRLCIGCKVGTPICISGHCPDYDRAVGATEQKAIDEDHLREVKKMAKEKAFQWICESITLYVTYNEEDGYIIDYDEMRKDFFKEMEE